MTKHAQIQRDYRRRMRQQGLQEVSVWVPVSMKERLKKYANKLVKEWSK